MNNFNDASDEIGDTIDTYRSLLDNELRNFNFKVQSQQKCKMMAVLERCERKLDRILENNATSDDSQQCVNFLQQQIQSQQQIQHDDGNSMLVTFQDFPNFENNQVINSVNDFASCSQLKIRIYPLGKNKPHDAMEISFAFPAAYAYPINAAFCVSVLNNIDEKKILFSSTHFCDNIKHANFFSGFMFCEVKRLQRMCCKQTKALVLKFLFIKYDD